MVEVPIHYQDSLEAVISDKMSSPDGDVVEKAESHGTRCFGVVTGRPDQGESVLDFPFHDGVYSVYNTPSRQTGYFP